MTEFAEYEDLDGLALAELVRKGDVTASELVETAIARIERYNPRLNAVVYPLFARARAQARAAADLPDGPFRGVPFLIKDLLSALAGEPMQQGSRMYAGWCPPTNSALVDRYLASGAVILGKTNTPEFGLLPTTEPVSQGASHNPWDLERTPGGSSGGSGAAVAARLVPLAAGGDGGGSIRIPSSCCGLFGLKPTRGRTPTGPFSAEGWNGFAIEHVLTRSVRDSAAMLDVVSGWYPGDFHYLPRPPSPFLGEVGAKPKKLRIAVSTAPYLPAKVHSDAVDAVDDVAGLLRELGHEVVDAAPTLDSAAFARAFVTVIGAQTASGIRRAERQVGRKAGRADFEVRTRLSAAVGKAFDAADYVDAVALLLSEARRVHEFLEGFDVILNPTVSQPPPKLGFLDKHGPMAVVEKLLATLPVGRLLTNGKLIDQAEAEAFDFVPWTPVYNVTGQPSMSVPLFWNADDLPVGTMFTAKFGNEALLFRLASQLEAARPWAGRRPPLIA